MNALFFILIMLGFLLFSYKKYRSLWKDLFGEDNGYPASVEPVKIDQPCIRR